MPRHLKSHTLFLCGVLAALLVSGALRVSAADACSQGALKVAPSFDVGVNNGFTAVTVVTADFNGDGRPDFAANDSEGNSVAVLLNDGTGWFGAPKKFPVGAHPSSVAVADLNGDGKTDLVVTNFDSNNVSVLLGAGGGLFGPASNFAVGSNPIAVAFGDFNGDSKLDMAVLDNSFGIIGGDITVLLGDGSGSFSQVAGSPIQVSGDPAAIAVADFNSDSKSDLVITTFNGTVMALGDGTGHFSAPTQVTAFTGAAVAATDLNGDGKTDLVMGSGGLMVLMGDGTGNFSAPVTFKREGNGAVTSIALADLDGDGKLDVAAASNAPAGVTYFKGDGAGGFSQTKSYLADNNPNSIAVGDFDGDGKPDIATSGDAVNVRPLTNISVLRNEGGGNFDAARAAYSPSPQSSISGTPFDIALGDFNGDGREDMAVLHRGQSSSDFQGARVNVLLRDADGNFTSSASIVYFNGSFLYQVIAADFNKDGKTDIAVAGTISVPFTHVISVSLSNGDGTFAAPININTGFFAQEPYSLAAGDFNNDGNPDIIVVGGQSGGVSVLFGNGAGNFTFAGSTSLGTGVDVVAVGDFNGDSKLDAVVTDFARQRVLVLLGNGAGGFAAPRPFAVGGVPQAVIVGDFNLDGKADIATVNTPTLGFGSYADDGSASVLLGDGAGGFAAAVNYRAGAQASDITTGDFDGDGKPDLAVAAAQGIQLLNGDGAGNFAPVSNFNVSGGPSSLVAYDFDGDGRSDIAAALPASYAEGVFYSQPPAPQPCLFADDVTVTEGDSGTTDAQVNVRLSGPSAQAVKVNYIVRSFQTAVVGQDFLPTSGTLTFQPGETAKSAPVPIVGDTRNEDTESLTLHLSGAAGAHTSDGVAKITILDNDPPPTISISDASATETNSSFDNNPMTFTVTLSAPSGNAVSVDYATANGTATAGSDYDGAQGTLVFPAGVTSETIKVNVRGDLTHEPDETFFVNLSNARNGTIADGQGQGTIIDNDPVPSITVSDASGFERTGVDSPVSLTVSLSNPSSSPVSVDFATADGTATAGSDYVATSGTVTFNPGETQKNITVTIKDDTIDEVNETFFVNLSNPVNASIADGQAVCTIFDNDGPTVSIGDVSAAEGQSGTTNFVFTVSLSAPSVQDVSVNYSTANGTATSNTFPADFQSVSGGFLLIRAGATSGTITVRVNGDLVVEPDETFFVNLSNPQNCTIARGQGVGTILNDDGPGKFQFASASFNASEADPSAVITVVRAAGATGAATVNYSTSDGTATAGSDYTPASGTLSFAAGETEKTFSVPLMNDLVAEPTETVNLTLSSPTGATLGDIPTAVLNIADDPRPAVQFSSPTFSASEADRQVGVLVKRLGDATRPVSVNYATQDGTASERADYNLTIGTLSFAAGETEKTIGVLLTDDAIAEGQENFSVLLSAPSGCRLGDVTKAAVTINNDDAAGTTNPVDADAQFFVRQHYHDFLNREPDQSGLQFWTNEITSCGADAQCREVKRINVSAAFFLSIEFQQTGYLVYRTYKAAYGAFPGTPLTMTLRQFVPDTQGLGRGVIVGQGDWQQQLEANKQAYMSDFVGRPEFVSKYPLSLTADQFVDALNQNAGGALSQGERDQLVSDLASGAKGRAEVLRAVAEDPDFVRAEFDRAFVLMQYFGYLRRNPNDQPDSDFSGYNFWLSKLDQFNGNYVNAEMVKAFISSDEYRHRFGQ